MIRALIVGLFLWASPALAQAPITDPTARELSAIMAERERANNQRFDAQEKAVAAALAAAKEAVIKAEAAAEKRFDSVNEFRNTLKDQQITLAPRSEVEIRFRGIDEKLRVIETRQAQVVANADGIAWLWGTLVGAAGVVIALVSLIFAFKKNAPATRRG